MGALSKFGLELSSSSFFGQLWFLIGSSRHGIRYEEVGELSCTHLISFFGWLEQTLNLIIICFILRSIHLKKEQGYVQLKSSTSS